MKNILFFVVILFFAFYQNASATTYMADNCSQTAIQGLIDSAVDDDTINIPAGTCDWGNSQLGWTNKNINIIGAGIGNTNITVGNTAFHILATNASKMAWRISGMSLSGLSAGSVGIILDASGVNASSYGWRIDNVDFSWSSHDVILVYGPTWGLIDHINITKTNGTWILIADYTTNDYNATPRRMGSYSRSLDLDYGTSKAVYIEDSTFTCTGSCAVLDSSSGGARVVFRHNTSAGAGGTYLYAHWTRGNEIDGHKYEVYNNNMDGGTYGAGGGYPMRLESGTAVIYNNTFTNYSTNNLVVDERRGCGLESANASFNDCDGTESWDGNYGDSSAPGWPCLGQIGRGTGYEINFTGTGNTVSTSVPVLVWNNGTQAGCSTGGACTDSLGVSVWNPEGCTRTTANYILDGDVATHDTGAGNSGHGDADFCTGDTMPASCGTYTNDYTAYTYPHPLTGLTQLITVSNINSGGLTISNIGSGNLTISNMD